MGDRGREGVLRRMMRALAGQADEARRAAVERTNAKYPDAYPPGFVDREPREHREPREPDAD